MAEPVRLPRALPRGRHALPRDVVLVSQRRRLLEAVVESVAHRGYPATTVADIVSRAGVSRGTFYENFADKQECFLAAYMAGSRVLFEQVEEAGRTLADPVEQLRAATREYLGVLSHEQAWSRACLIDITAVGAGAHDLRREVNGWYIGLLRRWHDAASAILPGARPVPEAAFGAAVAAVNDLVATNVRRGAGQRLDGLEEDILYIELSLLGGAGLDQLNVPATRPAGADDRGRTRPAREG